MSKDTIRTMRDAKATQWEAFKQLARLLPDHHVLAAELFRTSNDETTAIFTVVRNHEPIQFVVRGDSRGQLKGNDSPPSLKGFKVAAAPALPPPGPPANGGDPSPDGIAVGEPPVKQPPAPGQISLAGATLAIVFGVGEQVPTRPQK